MGTVLSTTMAVIALPLFLQPAMGGATPPVPPATTVTAHQQLWAPASAPPVAESAVDGAPDAPVDPPPTSAPPEPDACADALAWVAGAGLPLPPGVAYRCPSDQFTHQGAA